MSIQPMFGYTAIIVQVVIQQTQRLVASMLTSRLNTSLEIIGEVKADFEKQGRGKSNPARLKVRKPGSRMSRSILNSIVFYLNFSCLSVFFCI